MRCQRGSRKRWRVTSGPWLWVLKQEEVVVQEVEVVVVVLKVLQGVARVEEEVAGSASQVEEHKANEEGWRVVEESEQAWFERLEATLSVQDYADLRCQRRKLRSAFPK